MREIPSVKNLVIPMVLVASLFVLQLQRSTEQTPRWRYQGMIMGTTFDVQAYHPVEIKSEVITEALEAVNERMSTYIDSSELSKLNASTTPKALEVSSLLRRVLTAAKKVTAASGGAFDVTVGPLVNAWGFGPEGRLPTPTTAQISALKERCGDHLWTLNEAGLTKSRPDVALDLSAIAKGFAVDEVGRALEAQGVKRYWVEVGGEVRVKGQKTDDRAWRVGVERPAGEGRTRIMKVISLKDMSIATSGDYRNRYVDDQGVIRSHTIDPRTGEPVKHLLASVSVLHPENMLADAWATALNVLGPEEGLKVANQHKIAAFFIIRQNADPQKVELDLPETEYEALTTKAFDDYMNNL